MFIKIEHVLILILATPKQSETFSLVMTASISLVVALMGKFIIGILNMEKVQFSLYLVLRTFRLKRIPFTAKFHPTMENSFLVGSNNKKILQFDLNTGTKAFEYSAHLGTINTITFIEENKFVTTADDKKLFIWEYGIPVVTKHVS